MLLNNTSNTFSDLTRQLRHHERQLGGIEDQQRKVLEAVRRETKRLEQRRISVARQMEMERVNLISMEHRYIFQRLESRITII